MNKEQIEEIFELGAQAQYECWNPQGEGDVGKFAKLKDKAVKLFSIHSVSNWVDSDRLPEHLEKVLVFGKLEPWSENELHTAVLNKAGGLNHWYTGGTRMHEVSKWKNIIAPPCY